MEFCIDATELRKALADIERAEANGFNYCLATFRLTSAGWSLSECRASFDDLIERAHPTDGNLCWGRCQGVTRNHRFVNGKLVPLMTKAAL